MGKNIRRAMALLMSLAMVVCLAPGVFAASFNETDNCKLTVNVNKNASNVKVDLYKVADAEIDVGYIKYTNTSLFDYKVNTAIKSEVVLGHMSRDEWLKMADRLGSEVSKEEFNAQGLAVEGTNVWLGKEAVLLPDGSVKSVTYNGLKRGLYLVTMESSNYNISPTLVCVPCEKVGDDWKSEVTINVKASSKGGDGGDKYIIKDISVIKKWVGDSAEDRPESITITLRKNGQVFRTITLDKENNWSWTEKKVSLKSSDKLTIDEESVPEGYVFTSSGSGTYALEAINTKTTDIPEEDPPLDPNPPGGDTPGSDTPPTDIPDSDVPLNPGETPDGTPGGDAAAKLPQTGQLWWPVPILAVAGILMFTIGWTRSRREDADSEA